MYRLLLLDADGTLFDFVRAERHAFAAAMQGAGLPHDDDIHALYARINDSFWRMLERGEIARDKLVVARFAELLGELGADGDPAWLNERYLDQLGQSAFLLPHAVEVCRELAQHCRLVIATNGVSRVQHSRLALSELAPWISLLVASGEAGADKPDPAFFDFLFARCGHAGREDVLMVGDSPGADVLGGQRSGVDTCWFNPLRCELPDGVAPTHTIHDLRELPPLVLAARP